MLPLARLQRDQLGNDRHHVGRQPQSGGAHLADFRLSNFSPPRSRVDPSALSLTTLQPASPATRVAAFPIETTVSRHSETAIEI